MSSENEVLIAHREMEYLIDLYMYFALRKISYCLEKSNHPIFQGHIHRIDMMNTSMKLLEEKSTYQRDLRSYPIKLLI